MDEGFDPVDFLAYLRRHARFAGIAIGSAVALTAVASFLAPKRYTATATLIIEPPVASDPRAATAVTPVYLESLRTYEQFAASDTLFAKACEAFHLARTGEPCTESFKRRVLRVVKLKDTRLMQVSVTLPDPKTAQQMVQFLASETVALNKSLARDGERDALGEANARLSEAREEVRQAREAQEAAAGEGKEALLAEEIRSLNELKARVSLDLMRSRAEIAELSVQNTQAAAAEQRRIEVMLSESIGLDRRLIAQSATLAALRARRERAAEGLVAAQSKLEIWSRRANEAAAGSGLRSEQLRIVDPGVVPRQPSFPNPPLFIAVALCLSVLLCLALVTVRYGLDRRETAFRLRASAAEPIPSEYRVVRGGQRS